MIEFLISEVDTYFRIPKNKEHFISEKYFQMKKNQNYFSFPTAKKQYSKHFPMKK